MTLRPPTSTLTDTLLPYTTLVRSGVEMTRANAARDWARGRLIDETGKWRPRPESNRGARICSPQRNNSAKRPSAGERSEEHTSELQSLMRISYAVFCLKKKTHTTECQDRKIKCQTTSDIRHT